MNTADRIDDLLSRVADKQLLLSLAERADSSPMWAHYAENSRGFVIAFDTNSSFFRRGKDAEAQGLQKVRYFDGRLAELMDDPFGALFSKQSAWSYEEEWRLSATVDQVSQQIEVDGETIHLLNFPREAVQRVVLGVRASERLQADVRRVLDAAYHGVQIRRMKADRSMAKLREEPT